MEAANLDDIDFARQVISDYEETFSGMTQWKKDVIRRAKREGYSETLGGRRRRLDFNSDDVYDVYRAERQAVNHVVQGTASEICKRAMRKIYNEFPWPEVKMLVQVHDEIMLEVPEESAPEWAAKMETAMGDGEIMMDIPLVVEASYAGNWYEAK